MDEVVSNREVAEMIDAYWREHPESRTKRSRSAERFTPQVREELMKLGWEFEGLEGVDVSGRGESELQKLYNGMPYVSDAMIRDINSRMSGEWVDMPDGGLEREGLRAQAGEKRDVLGTAADVVRREDWHRENERGGGVRVEVAGEEGPEGPGGGGGGRGPRFSLTPEEDKRYFDAIERGDIASANRMVEGAAGRAGYSRKSDYQGGSAFNGV